MDQNRLCMPPSRMFEWEFEKIVAFRSIFCLCTWQPFKSVDFVKIFSPQIVFLCATGRHLLCVWSCKSYYFLSKDVAEGAIDFTTDWKYRKGSKGQRVTVKGKNVRKKGTKGIKGQKMRSKAWNMRKLGKKWCKRSNKHLKGSRKAKRLPSREKMIEKEEQKGSRGTNRPQGVQKICYTNRLAKIVLHLTSSEFVASWNDPPKAYKVPTTDFETFFP